MQEIQLHDIKDLTIISDYSFYIFLFVILFIILLCICVIYFLIKHFKQKNSTKKRAYAALESLDLKDSKKAAYAITKYGRILIQQDREKKLFEELIEALEPYKYKKTVDVLDITVKEQFERFMDAVDVK